MLTYIIPFIILILIVVFILSMVTIILQKYGVGVQIFPLVLEKKFLAGMINQEQDGKYAGFHWVVM